MLIRHLEFFVTLAEEAHFGRAAALCGVSQPALSVAIRKLEEDLGTPLIRRGQRFEGLTAEGERVLVWGRQILSDYGALRSEIGGRRKGGLTGVLRIGVAPAAMPLLPGFCAAFEARHPLARLRLQTMPLAAITAGLADLTLEGGFGLWPRRGPPGDGVQAVPLGPARWRFACRADHPFATGGPITMAEALTQPLCLLDDLPQAPARGAITCTGLDAVLAHLRSGGWASLVPEGFAALLAPEDDLRLIEITEARPMGEIGGLLLRRQPQSPLARAFEEVLKTLAADPALFPSD